VSGILEVDMFTEEVDSEEHPEAAAFRRLLEEVAIEYSCNLDFFSVEKGTVSFSFDDDRLTADIIRILQDGR
jgi:hypothetical protein